jgi:succinate dehydrogenase/fumarate reductase flavoprotein subunit
MRPVESLETVDLIVVGAGMGGMSAALIAAKLGLSVLVLEKSDQVGGTTAMSAGTLWVPGALAANARDSAQEIEHAALYLRQEISGSGQDPVMQAFLSTGPEAVEFMQARTAVRFIRVARHPDYHPDTPGAAEGGRALVSEPFDGRELGGDFAKVRSSKREFLLLGGMMVGKDDIGPLVRPFSSLRTFTHVARLLLRHLRDRLQHPRGTRLVMGNALVARLLYSLKQADVPIAFGAAVVELLHDNGGITGVVYQNRQDRRTVRARCGVLLATGGFSASPDWRAKLLGELPIYKSVAFLGNAGDGLILGSRAGAVLESDHARPAFWMPSSIMTDRNGRESIFPHIMLDRAKPGLIAVNAAGQRFVNEAASYHDFVEGMLRSAETVSTVPAWLICDRTFLRKYGLGLVHPGVRRLGRFLANGYLKQASTVEDLARQIGIDSKGLAATVARHNEFARSGVDADYGKGSNALNIHNGDPEHAPNPCIGPIDTPPFYGVAVYPTDLATSVGLRTDADARVLDGEGRPILGLYACGNDMASVMRGNYPGPGVTLGPALVFAYRAARHVASRKSRAVP